MDERVTLRTIADRAGVHVSTVSRTLRSPAVDTENAQFIRAIAAELGYTPDPNAASLRTQRSDAIGVLVPRLTDSVLATVYDAIEESANASGFDSFVANTHDDPEEQARRIRLLLSRRVDGLILGDARLDDSNLQLLADRNVPFVLANRHSGNWPAVTGDDLQGGHLVGTHLIERGHKQVAIIAGPAYTSTSVDRIEGCRTAIHEHGATVSRRDVLVGAFDISWGYEATHRLMSRKRPPTAIFAVDDFIAVGALRAFRERGIIVGHDVALVGYNDVPIAASLDVPLTTVRHPLRDIGRSAVALLQQILNGGDPRSMVFPTELVIRESSGP